MSDISPRKLVITDYSDCCKTAAMNIIFGQLLYRNFEEFHAACGGNKTYEK